MIRRIISSLLSLAILTPVILAPLLAITPAAHADVQYNPNDLISDSVFTNSNAMSSSAIQAFLNNQNSGLKTYSDTENCSTIKTPYSFNYYPHCGTSQSASTIIYDAAQAYGINPQAIIATLQKEQSLITTPNPSGSQINCAMGYQSCDSGYLGFFNQVDNGAWQLRTDIELMNGRNWWGYTPASYPCKNATSLYTNGLYPGNTVTFNNPGGQARTVTLANSATAALYCYTPHVGPYSETGYSGSYNFVLWFQQWFGSTSSYDYARGEVPPPANAFGNAGVVSLAGNWTGGTEQGFLYMTPNSSGGFEAGVMASASGGLQWRGTWWSQRNGAIGLTNTVFIPVMNRNGYTDLYYATSNDWGKPGFTLGLMANTGTGGFAYQGTQWVASSLTLAKTRFMSGNWTSSGHGSIAYATPNASGGFDMGVMDPVPGAGLQWRGTWWTQNNSAINVDNTVFIPADSNGEGLTDIYYANSGNWGNPGFSVGLMANTGSASFAYQGNQWANSSLRLNSVKFMPGNWTGNGRQGFAYASRAGTRGFDVGIMDSTPTGLQWRGTWWSAPSLPYLSTGFVPADTNGDGSTDLYYATPSGGGFSMALQHTNANTGGFTWDGVKWSAGSIPLNSVQFLP